MVAIRPRVKFVPVETRTRLSPNPKAIEQVSMTCFCSLFSVFSWQHLTKPGYMKVANKRHFLISSSSSPSSPLSAEKISFCKGYGELLHQQEQADIVTVCERMWETTSPALIAY